VNFKTRICSSYRVCGRVPGIRGEGNGSRGSVVGANLAKTGELAKDQRSSREETMPVNNDLQKDAGYAIAAFALAQLSFLALVRNGVLTDREAQRMLEGAIEVNEAGAPSHQLAARLLQTTQDRVISSRPAPR
jgi:hypothetical protein